MFENLKLLFSEMSGLSVKKRLGENADTFISGVAYIHFARIKIMSLVALVVFLLLWIWDIIQFFYGKWDESIGYQIVTYFHTFLLVFLIREFQGQTQQL